MMNVETANEIIYSSYFLRELEKNEKVQEILNTKSLSIDWNEIDKLERKALIFMIKHHADAILSIGKREFL